ncbi:MAG: Na+/H+ antiporter subunit E [Phycisphaerales bacterium]|nr:MAG: Na+/H+ antiporter subunit E [Phycisphaerales bacterium]
MNTFLVNIVLALLWSAAIGEITLPNLMIGFVVGYMVLWFARPLAGPSRYFNKGPQAVRFLLFYLGQLVLSNFRVAYDVLTPKRHMRPGVIAIPLDAKTDLEITLFANFLTMTPGTLSLDVSEDRKMLYIHAMFIDDPDTLRKEIKEGFERPLLELLR